MYCLLELNCVRFLLGFFFQASQMEREGRIKRDISGNFCLCHRRLKLSFCCGKAHAGMGKNTRDDQNSRF